MQVQGAADLSHEALRLRVLVPRGALPAWFGDVLLGLDSLASVRLQLERTDPPRGASFAGSPMQGWPRHPCALRPWAPAPAAQARLASWEEAAVSERGADISLTFDARLHLPLGSAGLASGRAFTLCDDAGEPLYRRFPMLRSIVKGDGIRLHCLERGPSGAWTLRRTLHVPSRSRYLAGLSKAVVSMQRLVQLTLSDLQIESAETDRPRASPIVFEPRDPGREEGSLSAAWQGICGSWREWYEQQRSRWISEYWRIGVIDAPIGQLTNPAVNPSVRWITTDSHNGYWADPFGLPGDPGRLACEFFNERTGIGHLEMLEVDADDRLVDRSPIAVGGGGHSSFPSIFELDGKRFGLAETIARRQCMLHEVDDSGVWRAMFPLLENVAAADPVLFSHGGRYWLAYTDADLGEGDSLCFRHAERLEGPWHPHPANPVKIDVTSARMAGNPFWHDGALYRPAQDCLRTYGAAVVLNRVVTLTPTAFGEVKVRRLAPVRGGPCPDGLHTLTAWGNRTLVDGKRHGVNPVTLQRKFAQARRVRRGLGVPAAKVTLPNSVPDQPCVFVYVPHLRVGGGETSMLRLAHGFAQQGLQVHLVVHTRETCELPLPTGVNLLSLDCGSSAAAVTRLAAALRRHRPCWLLSAFPHTNMAAVGARILSLTQTRCIVTEHAPLSQQIAQQGGWRYRLLPPLLRWSYRRADAIVAVSNGVRDDLLAMAGLAVPPVVIRNPVLPPDFLTELSQAPDHPWLLDPELEVVLSVCRLSAEKDLPTLLRAFAEVRRTRPAARLLMAGEGAEREQLKQLIASLGLSESAQLPGRTNQPLRWMKRAAVFVLPSRFEGFGNVLVEAMACGTPVVSTDCPVGPREVLEGGRWGALVPVGDVPAMAREICRALETGALPAGAREAARQHTQARACAEYRRLFESLSPSTASTS